MLRRIVDFSIREPLLVLLVFALIGIYGWYAKETTPVDAIPNIGQNQVIVTTEWPGRSPKDIEDQVTYPLSIALLAVPGAESVRGKSLFGHSFVQITFDDSTDFYWARSRVSEGLAGAAALLPPDVVPRMGPDATSLGQVFYYVLDAPPGVNLADLRSVQDFTLKYALQSVPGVAEVASIGGYVKQYQVDVDPNKLKFHGIPISDLVMALKNANTDVGAKTLEQSGMEFIIQGKGFLGGGLGKDQVVADIENSVVSSHEDGVPVRIKDLGYVQMGSSFRRGALDLNGSEAVGGIVVIRYGENPQKVIDAVKDKIKSIEPSLGGIKIVDIYDRTNLINETITTLTSALNQQILITVVVVLIFLLHFRTALVIASVLPLAVLLAFIAMKHFKLEANIMSLAGIAIAIGNMIDMGIIIAENIYRRLTEKLTASGGFINLEQRLQTISDAVMEIVPALMTAVATTVVSFLPVFFLTGRDFKLFSPLAWTKTYALMGALFVAIVMIPALARLFLDPSAKRWFTVRVSVIATALIGLGIGVLFTFSGTLSLVMTVSLPFLLSLLGGFIGYQLSREQMLPVDENPVSILILKIYKPLLTKCLNAPRRFLFIPVVVFLIGMFSWLGLTPLLVPIEGAARMVNINVNDYGAYRYLKSNYSGLKSDDWIALDEGSFFYMPTFYPAVSFSSALQILQVQDELMAQIPEVENVLGKIGRSDSALDPAPASMIETYITLKPKASWRAGIKERDIWNEITKIAAVPGVTPASYLQPIEGRVVMLQSGIKAPMAVRIYGDDLGELARAAEKVATKLKEMPVVDKNTINPDIVLGKPYIEFKVDRLSAARYGMNVKEINDIISTALGGYQVGNTFEGRERYPIQVSYERGFRDQLENLQKLPVITPKGETIPLHLLAKMETTWGPAAITSEDARLVAHIAFSPARIVGSLETIDTVMKNLYAMQQDGSLSLPIGYELKAVGSFQSQIEANQRLLWMIPLVILINFIIIYLQFRDLRLTFLVFAGVPIAFGGGMVLLALLGLKINTATWIGFIALFGLAVDDGVIIATFIKDLLKKKVARTREEIRALVIEAGSKRVRPCLMTTVTTLIALLPVLLSDGRGADVARSIAIPIFGGMFFALFTLITVPVVFAWLQERKIAKLGTP